MKNFSKTTQRNIIFHFIYWSVYIGYELFYVIAIYHIKTPLLSYFFFYACNIGVFYLHFCILNRYLNQRQSRYFLMVTLILAEIIVTVTIKILWDYFSMLKTVPPNQLWVQLKGAAGMDFHRTLFYIYFSTVLWSAINFGRFKRNTAEALLKKTIAEKANTELKFQFTQAQNAFLKEQINPHLLFNTLNAIYSTVYINSPKDSEAVLLLSEIMRYSYEEPDSRGLVTLESELFQLKNLIKLNSYRFRDTIQIDFEVSGEAGNYRIIPLVLLTLTENMFKHGDLQQTPGSLNIAIDDSGRLSYLSKNIPKQQEQFEPGSHVGLSNTRLRLDYAYPNNYRLEVTQTDKLFSLALNINLAYERSNY